MLALTADRDCDVFVVGRRSSSIADGMSQCLKRVASAVGEGAMAVQQVHRFLAEAD